MNSGRAGRQGEPLMPDDPRFNVPARARRYDAPYDPRSGQRFEQREGYRVDYPPPPDHRRAGDYPRDADWRRSAYAGGGSPAAHYGGNDYYATPRGIHGEHHRASPRYPAHSGEESPAGGGYAYARHSPDRGAAGAALHMLPNVSPARGADARDYAPHDAAGQHAAPRAATPRAAARCRAPRPRAMLTADAARSRERAAGAARAAAGAARRRRAPRGGATGGAMGRGARGGA
jgi:hypothetical protein